MDSWDSTPTTRLARAHDASHFLLYPSRVLVPRDAEEVSGLLIDAGHEGASVTIRSGGTSLSGQGVTDGWLVDTRRHFRSIEVLDDGQRVAVQPGATLRAVNTRLARHGRKLGPDPASEVAATIGGVLANNSSGMSCGTTANAYRTLESMTLVLPSGATIDTGGAQADEVLRSLEPRIHEGLLELRERIRGNTESRTTLERLFSIKNTMGYGLNSFLDHDRPIDILAHLAIGSEGTLGFIASATMRTLPVLPHAATTLVVFRDAAGAIDAIEHLRPLGCSAIELMDATSLRVAQTAKDCPQALADLAIDEHAALLIEIELAGADALQEALGALHSALRALPCVGVPAVQTDAKERARLWRIRKGLYATVAGNRPSGTTAILEDIAVPGDRLLAASDNLTELLREFRYPDAVMFGHAKDGNLHFMIAEQFDTATAVDRFQRFTDRLVDVVLDHGGTLKAEHGTGRMMAPYVERQYGQELFDVMWSLKHLVDPKRIMSPGVVLTHDPTAHLQNLKTSPTVESVVDRCVECGYCEPVCPSADLTLTPRQRIVIRRELTRAVAAGDGELASALRADFEYAGIDTCAVDGMCALACPLGINTGDLVRDLRRERRQPLADGAWGLAASHWQGTTTAVAAALTVASRVPGLASLASGVARRTLGEDRVPSWSRDLPRGGAPRTGLATDAPDVVFFPSCTSSMFAPGNDGIGATQAFLELCARAGIAVRIPEGIGSLCCGTPWKSKGLATGLGTMAARTRDALDSATVGGTIPIVSDASSCTEGLQHLLTEARGMRMQVLDSVEFVALHVLPRLTISQLAPSVVVHLTCSSRALGSDAAVRTIAAAIAGEVVVPDTAGCCGFAGDRGMLHPELTAAATAPTVEWLAGTSATLFASSNRTCELGMTRATGRPYRHILELLLEAVTASN